MKERAGFALGAFLVIATAVLAVFASRTTTAMPNHNHVVFCHN